jgi:Tfp pilus assembly protein PilO
MIRPNQHWKKWVRWGLAVVLAVDVLLLIAAWRASKGGQQAQAKQRDLLTQQYTPLNADVARARAISEKLPRVQGDCDNFIRNNLREASGGYSVVLADLGQIAEKAGLRAPNTSFRQEQRGPRGIVEVRITAAVEGDYSSLVRFINGLERSPNFYLLNSLTLASSTGGVIRLNLELRTYFRS